MSEIVLERLARVVARRGAHAAIEEDGASLSYAGLWRWAGAIGAALRRRGVGGGDLVAITAPKSAAYVAAMLGAWWAGAAFVPAGAELPPGRQRAILEEAAPRVTLDRGWLEGLRGDDVGGGDGWARVGPEALAYVAFTSGSGGRPKGVMIAHRGVVGLLMAQIELFELSEETRSLLFVSTAFDAAISDIGTALLAGGTLVIEAGVERRAGEGLLAALARLKISYVDLPPALLAGLDPGGGSAALSACLKNLRTIVIGGEVCAAAAVRAWADRVRLVSVYGPTEATVCASAVVCDRGWHGPLLGAPLPGVIMEAVDGELWIGGDGVAIGYLGRPELDARGFVSVGEGGAARRFYRTGDRVRVGALGELEFVGRVDRQVKIGGVRIELDEVEARLGALPGVVEAAVEARAGVLVGFVAAEEPAAPPSKSWLRGQLLRDLPAAAIPRRFVWLRGRLPRGVSGKIDRGALAGLEVEEEGAAAGGAWTGAAGALAAIWRRVLGVASVASEDRFVELGGDSMSALEVVAAASACGLGLSGVELLSGARSFGEIVRGMEGVGADLRAPAELLAAVDAAASSRMLSQGAECAHSREYYDSSAGGERLITGATGFVGSALLGELLAMGEQGVVCLVRAASVEAAYSRLAAALAVHERALDRGRVRVVLGDLEQRRFGVDEATWRGLCERVEVIVHSGARVHLMEAFEALAPTNLGGTAEALALALAARRRPLLALISTLSVFVGAEPAVAVAREADDRSGVEGLVGGYTQSKWAAEALLRRFAPPLPALCVRLGLVTGSSTSGRAGPREQLSMFLRGLAALGAAPRGFFEGLRLDVTPVDYAAAALAELLARPRGEAGIETVHVASERGATGAALVAALRAEGVAIEVVEPGEFLARGAEASGRSAAAALAYLSLCRRLPGAHAGLRGYDLFLATGVRSFVEVNARLTARCPAADEALLRRYVRAALAEGLV